MPFQRAQSSTNPPAFQRKTPFNMHVLMSSYKRSGSHCFTAIPCEPRFEKIVSVHVARCPASLSKAVCL